MKASVPVFYRPSNLSLACPHLMKPLERFTAMFWLDANAMQVMARVQRDAYLRTMPDAPQIFQRPEAELPAYLSEGETPPWRMAGRIRSLLPAVMEWIVKRQHDANEMTAIIHLSSAINREFQKRKIQKPATSGELWAGYVQGIKTWDKNYAVSCLIAERWFISSVMDDHEAAQQIATVLADAVENPGKPADYYLIPASERPPELLKPEASASNKKPK